MHVAIQPHMLMNYVRLRQVHDDKSLQIHGALALPFLRSDRDDSPESSEDI